MQINPLVFREYDIRGTVDVDLSEDFAYLLGRAYASLAREQNKNNIAIGRDCRLSSEAYAAALAQGITDGGIDVCLTGMGPTPQVYFALFEKNLGGAIQVTGSHNPSNMNGFKLCLGTHTLSGPDIQDLKDRVFKEDKKPKGAQGKKGALTELAIRDTYVASLIKNAKGHLGARKLKIVVDAGNGVGGLVGPEVLRALGFEVVEIFCEPDGRFPNHHPDPTVLENIVDLQNKVIETKADFGIGWDGDADRIGVVDERGQVIFGDMLIYIYGRDILRTSPGATIIGDVKCSSRLFDGLRALGGNAVMWKTGHSLIKSKLKELHGELAGEMSGHIFFKHRYFGFDDAIYASVRFAEIMTHFKGKASELLAEVPPMIATPELRIDCPENIKFKIPELAKKAFSEFKVETIDGVRVTFEKGWGLVRASNTQPVLVMRFEATDQEHLDKYQALVTGRIEAIKQQLS